MCNWLGTNGLEGIASLQERWPLARVVIVSAFDREAVVCEAIQRGAVEFHAKTECPEHLLQRIQALLSGGPEPATLARPPPLSHHSTMPRQVLVEVR